MRGLLPKGAELRCLRQERALTQEALAVSARCDVKTVRNAEKGQRIDAATLQRIAEALESPIAALVLAEQAHIAPASELVQLFWRWQEASNNRDVDGMLACYHPDATVHIAGADDLPGGGEFRGLDAIRGQWAAAQDAFETDKLTHDHLQVDAVEDHVLARGWATATVRATGQRVTSLGVHEFQVEDGKFIRHTLVIDTAALRKCLEGGA